MANPFTDALKVLLRPLAKSLAHPVLAGAGLLVAAATMIKYFEKYEWHDAVLSSQFLTIMTLVLLYILSDVYRHRRTIPKKQQYVAYLLLVAMVAVSTSATWNAWSYIYYPIGIYADRHWHRDGPSYTQWNWNIQATTDSSLSVVIHLDDVCLDTEIDTLYPRPLTSVSPESSEIKAQDPHHREWQFKGLQRSVKMQFVLGLKRPIENPDKCITHEIRLGED